MRPVTILAIGLVASGTTAMLVYRAVENRVVVRTVPAGSPDVQLKPVVVASGEVPFGGTLTLEQLKLVNWPVTALPPNAFETREALVGRVAITRFGANEPVTNDKLAPTGSHGLLPLVIEQGMRAVTVRVNEVAAVGGFIAPGSHVDVLVTAEVKPPPQGAEPAPTAEASAEPGRHTRTVLQDVQVVALGQLLESSGQPKPGEQLTTATLLVSPEQGELLALGAAEGTLQLVLRNFEDHQVVRSDGKTATDLFDSDAERSALADNKVEMIRGSQRFLVSF